ncbi:MAG: L-threonylcarbamoyladenylate synthase, partial [Saprospiraceae bacterium]
NHSMGSQNHSMGSQNRSMGSQNHSMESQNRSMGSQNHSMGSQNRSMGSQNHCNSAKNKLASLAAVCTFANKNVIGTDLDYAIALLQQDELVAIPTETVYGLAGNALHDKPVSQIFAVKNRPSFDPLIVHTSSLERLQSFVTDFPEKARILAAAFLPGPLTLLLPKKALIPDIVTAGSPLVALRIPQHPLTLQLLQQLDFPLAAPSANPFGYISPTTAQHVAQQLGEKIPYILDGGACAVGLESTIVGFEQERVVVYRKGGIPIEAIEALVGRVGVQPHSTSNPQAPGMLQSHYAPRVPLVLGDINTLLAKHEGKRIGIISFQKTFPTSSAYHAITLSPSGNFAEAARQLFAGMRYLDGLKLDVIIAELLPEANLGRAINDRLRRAAAVDERRE